MIENINPIYTTEALFNKEENKKVFIKILIELAISIQLKNKSFHLFHQRENIAKTNLYLLTEQKLVIVAFIMFLKEISFDNNKVSKILDLFVSNNRNILKENIINLRHILGKAGIACKNNYTSYQRLCKRDKKIVSVIYFNSFSLNYQIVKDNIKDHTMLEELVSKDYKKYINRKTSKKIIRLFLYEEIDNVMRRL